MKKLLLVIVFILYIGGILYSQDKKDLLFKFYKNDQVSQIIKPKSIFIEFTEEYAIFKIFFILKDDNKDILYFNLNKIIFNDDKKIYKYILDQKIEIILNIITTINDDIYVFSEIYKTSKKSNIIYFVPEINDNTGLELYNKNGDI